MASAPLTLVASAQQILAQQNAQFLCLAPAGHVCQFEVRTEAGAIDFSLASGERHEVAGITPYRNKYCVCDPGPCYRGLHAPDRSLVSWGLVGRYHGPEF